MITPEYVDYLINESRRLRLPVAPASLSMKKVSERTTEYKWVVSECPCCGEEHTHHAGYELDEAHTHLGKHWCGKAQMWYLVMRDYDVKRDADKIAPYKGLETADLNGRTYPVARVRLHRIDRTDGTADLQWIVPICPYCYDRHHHDAGTNAAKVNKTLDLRKSGCVGNGRFYVLKKEKGGRQ